LIELDDQDDDDQYLIAYDAVCEYSNKQHSTFNQYQLPYEFLKLMMRLRLRMVIYIH
jgi:hypothetical protein